MTQVKTYENFRQNIKSGDLLAFTHTTWGTWYDFKVQVVRIWTKSAYTHVGVAWVTENRIYVFESVVGGIRPSPLSRAGDFWHLNSEAAGGEWCQKAETFMLDHIGDRYSEWQAFLASINKLDVGSDRFWQCAEFSIMALKEMGVDLKGVLATPAALVDAMQSMGCITTKVLNKERN